MSQYYETRKEFLPKIYNDLALMLLIPIFVLVTYWIEVLAAMKVNNYLIVFFAILNQTLLLIYPIAASFIFEPNFIIATTLCQLVVAYSLKLISFHHVMYDIRENIIPRVS